MLEKPARQGGRPVREQFLIFGSPLIEESDVQELVNTLRSGRLGMGPKTRCFEEEFSRYLGRKHAVAVRSCRAGLHLALDVARVKQSDEVLTTPVTFAATANVIVHRGARPVLADVCRDTMNIDPD